MFSMNDKRNQKYDNRGLARTSPKMPEQASPAKMEDPVKVWTLPRDTWVATAFGNKMSFEQPDPKEVDLRDAAYHLSFLNRFHGGVGDYSVASHSILVSRFFDDMGPRLALLGLMHDWAETYLGDIASPVKNYLMQFFARDILEELHEKIMAVVYEHFNIAPPTSEERKLIKIADLEALNYERQVLMHSPDTWDLPLKPVAKNLIRKFRSYPGEKGVAEFTMRFNSLMSLMKQIEQRTIDLSTKE